MPPLVIDFHTHVVKNPLEKWTNWSPPSQLRQIRKKARTWFRPFAQSIHHTQTILRHFPGIARKRMDWIGCMVPLPGLLIESTPEDLTAAMDEADVNYAVVIAQAPLADNDLVMSLGAQNNRLLPVVNIPKGTPKPAQTLKNFVKQGAKALKIHPPADGEGVESPRYRALIKAASETGIPVILHTGCIYAPYLYRNPTLGGAEIFTRWYETFRDVKFVLAHMNFHDPHTALDLCEEFGHLYVDTSWQPAEMVAEATRRIGAERILFASDWPWVGSNLKVSRNRVEECVETGLLNPEQSRLILGENAVKLLGL